MGGAYQILTGDGSGDDAVRRAWAGPYRALQLPWDLRGDRVPKSGSSKVSDETVPWRIYERIVAAREAEQVGMDMSVTANARIVGVCGVERQIDVLVDARWGDDRSRRIIVDAKRRQAKLDINDVESFEGMMRDCRAEYGVLVCPQGYTEGAQRRAQDAITIKILTLDQVDEFGWTSFADCFGRCAEEGRERSRAGVIFWNGHLPLDVEGLWAIIVSGTCDVCHQFHVWCWACGDEFALKDEEERYCGCAWRWFTRIEREPDNTVTGTVNAVHLLLNAGQGILAIDRRRMR